MVQLNRELNRIETGFNVLGSIPVVQVGSGIVRANLGYVQFLSGCGIGGLGLLGQFIHGDSKSMDNTTKLGAEHMMHGALNTIRGFGESIVGIMPLVSPVPLGVTLSVMPLTIQLLSKEGFAPRFKYDEAQSLPAYV